ncbi:MAG: replication-associated recombination protein A [Victivallales bacterium]|nr:replication-associated recombination protein A [Victivallales bacterium]
MEDNLFELEDPACIAGSSVGSSFGADVPLAGRMRPGGFEDYIGQSHILSPGKLLRRAIDADRFASIIFYGPPGTGKTRLAELIAGKTDSAFVRLSGVGSTVADIRKEIAEAVQRRMVSGRKTIIFIDEIHRFNKAQQDVLLPDIENGNIRFIGATTHNPNFYVIGPLLSRSLLFQLESLSVEDIETLLVKTACSPKAFPDRGEVILENDALRFLAERSEGDARRALNALEIAVATTDESGGRTVVDLKSAEESIQKKTLEYGDDGHYDTISAFIKSMRGSDPDAALYWLAKMLHAGEDIRFIARRITIFASEDIGNADPRALSMAVSALQAVEIIGMPEARIILAQAVTYCATAPKSNASYLGVDAALDDVRSDRVQMVPRHLRDSHYKGSEKLGHGKGYVYPHDKEGHFAVQDYIGVSKKYYEPAEIGYELKIAERLRHWSVLRAEAEKE